ncbi:gluconate 2-dehydrogenase [Salinibacillus kushneri]|uniref:Gluconate 2-dehydrogenase n=1 Tax=Salinibacillus kushneri TaxID=237682 RepID=A0A1H9Z2K3_9BACI|nr:D-glycerate dehydrogenase [Salinibacillus kushneri]SES75717.1 gluconate 2-dehydrogenase [Salinibacillus kushneri]
MKILAYERVEKPVLDGLKNDYEVRFFKDINPHKDAEFLEFLSNAHGIIGLELVVNKQLLEKAPNLKIVSNVSVGYNNLDIPELTKRNILATNTPGILTNTVADTALGLIISAARRIPELDQFVKTGKWTKTLSEDYYGTDVHHKKLGIIGMGRIGTKIAKRAHFGLDMDVLYYSRTRKSDVESRYNATYMELDNLLIHSDFICLITPLSKETEGMIGKREFQLMKKSAIFINVSRGKTIVEQDLIDALKNKDIRAAGLDVYEQEPVDANSELLKMNNVVTLPHIGSSTYETELKMSQLADENLRAGLSGLKPPNLLNPEVWEKLK